MGPGRGGATVCALGLGCTLHEFEGSFVQDSFEGTRQGASCHKG